MFKDPIDVFSSLSFLFFFYLVVLIWYVYFKLGHLVIRIYNARYYFVMILCKCNAQNIVTYCRQSQVYIVCFKSYFLLLLLLVLCNVRRRNIFSKLLVRMRTKHKLSVDRKNKIQGKNREETRSNLKKKSYCLTVVVSHDHLKFFFLLKRKF